MTGKRPKSKHIKYSRLPDKGDEEEPSSDGVTSSEEENEVEERDPDEFMEPNVRKRRSGRRRYRRTWTKRSLVVGSVVLGIGICYFVFVFAPRRSSYGSGEIVTDSELALAEQQEAAYQHRKWRPRPIQRGHHSETHPEGPQNRKPETAHDPSSDREWSQDWRDWLEVEEETVKGYPEYKEPRWQWDERERGEERVRGSAAEPGYRFEEDRGGAQNTGRGSSAGEGPRFKENERIDDRSRIEDERRKLDEKLGREFNYEDQQGGTTTGNMEHQHVGQPLTQPAKSWLNMGTGFVTSSRKSLDATTLGAPKRVGFTWDTSDNPDEGARHPIGDSSDTRSSVIDKIQHDSGKKTGFDWSSSLDDVDLDLDYDDDEANDKKEGVYGNRDEPRRISPGHDNTFEIYNGNKPFGERDKGRYYHKDSGIESKDFSDDGLQHSDTDTKSSGESKEEPHRISPGHENTFKTDTGNRPFDELDKGRYYHRDIGVESKDISDDDSQHKDTDTESLGESKEEPRRISPGHENTFKPDTGNKPFDERDKGRYYHKDSEEESKDFSDDGSQHSDTDTKSLNEFKERLSNRVQEDNSDRNLHRNRDPDAPDNNEIENMKLERMKAIENATSALDGLNKVLRERARHLMPGNDDNVTSHLLAHQPKQDDTPSMSNTESLSTTHVKELDAFNQRLLNKAKQVMSENNHNTPSMLNTESFTTPHVKALDAFNQRLLNKVKQVMSEKNQGVTDRTQITHDSWERKEAWDENGSASGNTLPPTQSHNPTTRPHPTSPTTVEDISDTSPDASKTTTTTKRPKDIQRNKFNRNEETNWEMEDETHPGRDLKVLVLEEMYKLHGTDFTNITSLHPPPYLSNFRNPCWREQTSPGGSPRMRCLPHFLVLGAEKSAVPDLMARIASHQHILKPTMVENNFWDNKLFQKSLHSYLEVFKEATEHIDSDCDDTNDGGCYHNLITGESSASYFWNNVLWRKIKDNERHHEPSVLIPHHIHRLLPDLKIIIILREPAERLYSEFSYNNPGSANPLKFEEYAKEAVADIKKCLSTLPLRTCTYSPDVSTHAQRTHIRAGMYSVFLRDWLQVYPKEQIHVLRFEDYIKNTQPELMKIFKFLEMAPPSDEFFAHMGEVDEGRRASRKRYMMELYSQNILQEFYRTYNIELSNLLGDRKYGWGY